MTPWRSKNVSLTTFGPTKNPNLQTRKKTLEPLDLLATVGQSCVCVHVSVLVSGGVCEERRCGVVTLKSPKKTYTKFSLYLSLEIKTNGSFTFTVFYE